MEKDIVKTVGKWGNSAGILLPREWLGNQVKIILIDRTSEIKKEVFSMLDDCLDDIIGIYLIGSYARGEQEEDSNIDILAISNSVEKELVSGKYRVSIKTLNQIKKNLLISPLQIVPMLREAKVIMNPHILEELKESKVNKSLFKKFIEDTKGIIKTDKEFARFKEPGEESASKTAIYSLIAKLRGIFSINCALENKKYTNKDFKKYLLGCLDEKEFRSVYGIYRAVRDKQKAKLDVKTQTVNKIREFLTSELKEFDKK